MGHRDQTATRGWDPRPRKAADAQAFVAVDVFNAARRQLPTHRDNARSNEAAIKQRLAERHILSPLIREVKQVEEALAVTSCSKHDLLRREHQK